MRFGLGFIDRVSYKIEGAVGLRTLVVEWRSVGHVGGETFDTHPTYLDALKFWASPAAMHLREHMGMLPPR